MTERRVAVSPRSVKHGHPDVPDVLGHLSPNEIGVERLAEPEMPGGGTSPDPSRTERIARAVRHPSSQYKAVSQGVCLRGICMLLTKREKNNRHCCDWPHSRSPEGTTQSCNRLNPGKNPDRGSFPSSRLRARPIRRLDSRLRRGPASKHAARRDKSPVTPSPVPSCRC